MSRLTDNHFQIQAGTRQLDLSSRTHLMGILNVTPDSFSDGGRFYDTDAAVAQAITMIHEGADILDIGGESTRPGAQEVDEAEEIRRVVPVIERIRKQSDIPISIDTKKSRVAEVALKAGATLINDVSALQADPKMLEMVASADIPVILMHMQGMPETMQKNPVYDDVVEDIIHFFEERIRFAVSKGVRRKNIILDPGIGFGKTVRHNLEILRRFDVFHRLGCPLLLGVSRKSFIGQTLGRDVSERLMGTAAAVAVSVMKRAHILRVHDVSEMRDVCRMVDLIQNPELLENDL